MHDFLDADADPANPILRGTERITSIDYLTDALGREASAFIDKHKASPWLCYLAFNAVHAPLQATEKYLDRFKHIADPKRRAYAALQSAMDDAVGVVLAKLREHGLERDTLVVFFSDNGGPTPSTTSDNGPLRGFKSQTWEGGIRVPFMLQWPGTIPAGQVDDRPVIQLDVLPTALAAAGVAVKPEWKLDGPQLRATVEFTPVVCATHEVAAGGFVALKLPLVMNLSIVWGAVPCATQTLTFFLEPTDAGCQSSP